MRAKAKAKAKPATKVTAKAKAKPKVKKAAKKPLKKKPVKKKKVAAKKPRVALTDEEKLRKQIKILRETALLATPKLKPYTAWTVLLSEYYSNNPGSVIGAIPTVSSKYKSLSPEELEVSTSVSFLKAMLIDGPVVQPHCQSE